MTVADEGLDSGASSGDLISPTILPEDVEMGRSTGDVTVKMSENPAESFGATGSFLEGGSGAAAADTAGGSGFVGGGSDGGGGFLGGWGEGGVGRAGGGTGRPGGADGRAGGAGREGGAPGLPGGAEGRGGGGFSGAPPWFAGVMVISAKETKMYAIIKRLSEFESLGLRTRKEYVLKTG